MLINNKQMSTNDHSPRNQAKKNQLHKAFSTNCPMNHNKALRLCDHPPCRQTSQAATAIMTYKVVHTGPNNHPGGAQAGWVKLA